MCCYRMMYVMTLRAVNGSVVINRRSDDKRVAVCVLSVWCVLCLLVGFFCSNFWLQFSLSVLATLSEFGKRGPMFVLMCLWLILNVSLGKEDILVLSSKRMLIVSETLCLWFLLHLRSLSAKDFRVSVFLANSVFELDFLVRPIPLSVSFILPFPKHHSFGEKM